MTDTNEVKAIFPRQFVARWKNDQGQVLRIIQFVEEETYELKKLFVPANDYKTMGVQGMLGNKVSMLVDEDDDGRPVLLSIALLKK